jgi:hypothetical protein
MERKKAIETFIKHSIKARRTVEKLEKFKPGMSIKQYADALGYTTTAAWVIAHKYGLPFDNRLHHCQETREKNRRKFYQQNWDENKTIAENAILLGVKYQTAVQACSRYGLKAKYKSLTPTAIQQLKNVKKYLEMNLSKAEVGRLMGISRERVRQLAEQLTTDERAKNV